MLDFLQDNVDITELSNFKTKAYAKYYFEVNNRQDVDKVVDIVYFANKENLPILFVSGGTNMLFAFDKYNWIVVKNCLQWWTYNVDKKILEAYSSELISDISESLENDFSQDLWHRFIGLPWAIAGAVFWNAGCFWLEIENNFKEIEVLNLETRQVSIMSKMDMHFSYRSSILKQTGKYFIIRAVFDLSTKIEKYHSEVDNIDFRENKQPSWNTCWSFFKNPNIDLKEFFIRHPELDSGSIKKLSAGYLIEEVWLKGYNLKGAYFSKLHANFLMNEANASYKDLLELISLAQDKVRKEFDIELIPEVRIIYNNILK